MLGLKALLILAAYICITVAVFPNSSGTNIDPIPPDPDPPRDCPEGQWFWEAVSRCVPYANKQRVTVNILVIYRCAKYWIWNDELNHCAPRTPNVNDHTCPAGYVWKKYLFVCIRMDSVQPNPECGPGEWYWEAKFRCLPTIANYKQFRSPDNYRCPRNWYWNNDFRHCAPRRANFKKPQCPTGYTWRKYRFFCIIYLHSLPPNQCPPNQWPWKLGSNVCLPTGKSGETAAPPDGNMCPHKWYWHTILQRCAPPSLSVSSVSCPRKHYKHNILFTCVPMYLNPPQSCPPGQWLWKVVAKSVCLPILAPGLLNPPPHDHLCPENWSWHNDLGHCVPSGPQYASGACTIGFILDNANFVCVIDPDPLGALPPELNICPENQWFLKIMLKCLPNGGTGMLPPARLGIVCPELWYWHRDNHCAPPLPKNLGSHCPEGHRWDHRSFSCELDPLQHNARKA